ncbi:MAG: hypothetical protein GX189_00800 [Clostridiales bacterium]|nr:hypothetical protein [Clostridiales bacterium]
MDNRPSVFGFKRAFRSGAVSAPAKAGGVKKKRGVGAEKARIDIKRAGHAIKYQYNTCARLNIRKKTGGVL